MHVLVIGAGIAGLSSAWALAKRGHAVTLLEQAGGMPNPLSASADQHRIIRRAYGRADGYARTITEAFEAWDELWLDLGRAHFAPCGVLAVSQRSGDEAEVLREGLERNGTPYRLLEPAAAARDYPFLDPETFRYAYFSPEGGVLFSRRIADDLVRWLGERGVRLMTGARAVGMDAEAGRVTTASGETITADRVVVTAGAWTLRLLPGLSDRLTPFRTAVAYLDPPDDLRDAWRRAPAILDIGGDVDGYVLPPVDGTGLKVGAGAHKRPSSDPDADREAHPGEGERLRARFAPPFARISEYRIAGVVTCAYTFTTDSRFLAAETGKALAVSACSGHGYKFGAAVGRRIAAAVEQGDADALVRWLRAEDPERS
jgi:sarcosine oxidase